MVGGKRRRVKGMAVWYTTGMNLREKLKAMGIELPSVSGPFGSYVPAKRVGNLIFVAGQLPMKDGQLMATGQVPSKCSQDQATAAGLVCLVRGITSR